IGTAAIITDKAQIYNYLAAGSLVVDRGYTSHEHFVEVGLIHMNGRLYDPLLRRFLNADENIQDPYNTQNYNKYGYVLNNPLMFNDPSGEFFQFLALAIFWKAVGIGIAVGLASSVITAGLTGQQINIGGILKSAFIGGISAAVTFGIGSIFTGTGGCITNIGIRLGKGMFYVQAGAHALAQGVLSVVQGQKFMSAVAGGFFGSLGASGWSAVMGSSGGAMIAFGALAGGIGAELTGGNFWIGAIAGGIVAGLNHVAHSISNGLESEDTFAKRRLTKEEIELIGSNYPTYDKYPDQLSVYKEVGGELYKKYLENPSDYENTCAIRMSMAFEKSGINIGGDYYGAKGLKYYTSATRFYEAINARFTSFNGGSNMSQFGVAVQFVDKFKPVGKVYHVDIVFKNNGNPRFGNTLYSGHYNQFY
ncbi:T6SS effector amidase Tae4 family protein, partial [Weeksellaceae bacterium A-14]